jgi:glucose-1-phosphate thymidylyltransferase
MRKGIILAGGAGSRLYPATAAVSKQLLQIYDKPMVYFPLTTLMLAGVKEVCVISSPEHVDLYERLLGNGCQWGVDLSYCVQEKPNGLAEAYILAEDFLESESSILLLGDNLFYGSGLSGILQKCAAISDNFIFSTRVSDPKQFGVVETNEYEEIISIEEKPQKPRSNDAITGMYFFDGRAPQFAKQILPSARGELEITSLIQIYKDLESLSLIKLPRGVAWLDTGSHDGLLDAANFVRSVQSNQGLLVGSPDEVSYRNGWITSADFRSRIDAMGSGTYAYALRSMLSQE